MINFLTQATAEGPVIILAKTPSKVRLIDASNLPLNSSFLIVDGLFFKDGSYEVTSKENPALPENYDKWIGNLAPAERGVSSP